MAGAAEVITGKVPRCPDCGWVDVRRSMPKGPIDALLRIIGLVPYRCRSCGERFYRPQHDQQNHHASAS